MYLPSPHGTNEPKSKRMGAEKKHEQNKGAYQRGYDRGIERYGFFHHRLSRPQLQHSADATLDLIVRQLLRRCAVGVRPAVILPHRVRPLRQRHDPAVVKGVEHPHPVKAIPYELPERSQGEYVGYEPPTCGFLCRVKPPTGAISAKLQSVISLPEKKSWKRSTCGSIPRKASQTVMKPAMCSTPVRLRCCSSRPHSLRSPRRN